MNYLCRPIIDLHNFLNSQSWYLLNIVTQHVFTNITVLSKSGKSGQAALLKMNLGRCCSVLLQEWLITVELVELRLLI